MQNVLLLKKHKISFLDDLRNSPVKPDYTTEDLYQAAQWIYSQEYSKEKLVE